jgi:hypothetical protein
MTAHAIDFVGHVRDAVSDLKMSEKFASEAGPKEVGECIRAVLATLREVIRASEEYQKPRQAVGSADETILEMEIFKENPVEAGGRHKV